MGIEFKINVLNTANKSMKRLVDEIIILDLNEIDNFQFPKDKVFGLQVFHDEALFCFIVKFSSDDNNLICFGPGAHNRDSYNPPFFDRWSWYNYFDQSTIAYADPIFFFDEGVRLGWFTGGKDWHMHILAQIIKKLSKNNNINDENILFFGSSGGGFSSVALGTLIRNSKVLINNSQFFVMNYSPIYLEKLFEVLQDNLNLKKEEILEKFDYRFDVIKLFKKENYAPSIDYYLNIKSAGDVKSQGLPFIKGLFDLKCFNGLNIFLYEEFKKVPHEPLPSEITVDIIKHFSKINLNNIVKYNFSLNKFGEIHGLHSELNFYKFFNQSSRAENNNLFVENNSSWGIDELLFLRKVCKSYSKYNTARIDIKNEGFSNNHVDIMDISDKNALVSRPPWFKNNLGQGLIISSDSGNLYINFKCIGDGNLKIVFRGVDFRDNNNNRIPIYVKYTKINLNNQDLIDVDQFVSHDSPFVFEKGIKNNETFELNISWIPI